MSLPRNALSASPVPAALLAPDDAIRADLRVDYEMGGVAIGDASQGMLVRAWRAWTDGTDVWCAPDDTMSPVTHLVTGSAITEVSLCFDQNMRPVLAFMDGGLCKLNWFDSLAASQVTTSYVGAYSPMVCLDDKREVALTAGWADDLFFYIRSGSIYYRQQRDRYGVEYLLTVIAPDVNRIAKLGMGANLRLQLHLVRAPTIYVDLEADLMFGADTNDEVRPLLAGPVSMGRWCSRVFSDHEQRSFGWARVEAAPYPCTLILLGDGATVARLTVTDAGPMRLPAVRARDLQIQVESTGRIIGVYLGTSPEEV